MSTKTTKKTESRPITVPNADTETILRIPVSVIRESPFQVRSISGTPDLDNALMDLAKNIKEHGLINPITVRPIKEDFDACCFEVIAGHRRLAASRLAELDTIPVICRDLEDSVAEEVLVSENLFRQDLTPVEESKSVVQLLKSRDIAQVANLCQKSDRWVYRRASIDKMSSDWKQIAERFKLSAAFCEAIARLTDELQQIVLDYALDGREVDSLDQESVECNDILFGSGNTDDIQYAIQQNLRNLADAPWLTLCPNWCANCPKRTDIQPELWDSGQQPRCMDRNCWTANNQKWLKEAALIYEAANNDTLYVPEKSEINIGAWKDEADDIYTVPTLVPAGFYSAGKIVYTQPRGEDKNEEDNNSEPIATKKQIEEWALLHARAEFIKNYDASTVSDLITMRFIAAFGVNTYQLILADSPCYISAERTQPACDLSADSITDRVFDCIRSTELVRRVKPSGPAHLDYKVQLVHSNLIMGLLWVTDDDLCEIEAVKNRIAADETERYASIKKAKKVAKK